MAFLNMTYLVAWDIRQTFTFKNTLLKSFPYVIVYNPKKVGTQNLLNYRMH